MSRTLLALSLLVAIPACDAPAPVDAPGADVPEHDAPDLDAGMDAPALDAPELDAPELDAPELDAPELDTPAFDAPELDAPELDAPAPLDAPLDAGIVDAPAPRDAPATPDAPMPDAPPAPSVVRVAAGRIVTEGTGTTTAASVLLNVTPASPVDATVRILTTPGTATSPGDYRFLSDTVSIPRGATSVMAPFEIAADALDELDEQFEVMLIDPVGVTIGTATGTVTIADDDTADVYLGYDAAMGRAPEGSAASPRSIAFFLTRQASPVSTDVVVRARAGVGPTGAAGDDFVPFMTTWTFPPAATDGAAMFSIAFVGDATGEPDETFTVEIISVAGGELAGGPASLPLTILNDDPPTIGGCTTTTTVEAATGRHTFRITSAVPMVAGINVGYAYGGTASHGSSADYSRVSPTASTSAVPFPAGATSIDFTIDTHDDVTDEPDETVTLTLLSVSPGATLDTSCTVSTLTIEDDD